MRGATAGRSDVMETKAQGNSLRDQISSQSTDIKAFHEKSTAASDNMESLYRANFLCNH